MSTMLMNDGPILVAPRPVRVVPQWAPVARRGILPAQAQAQAPVQHESTLTTAFERISIMDHARDHAYEVTEERRSSPRELSPIRASPNPSEAWDDFLSILRPSFLQPQSTASSGFFRTLASPTFLPERTFRRSPRVFSPVVISESRETQNGNSKIPGSPISRTHTRNPFLRHESFESQGAPGVPSWEQQQPRLLTYLEDQDPISPRQVPLPSPAGDEEQLERL